MLLKVAWLSLLDRKAGFLLTLASLSISIFVVVCVEHIRTEAQESFNRTVSGVDLIVGARTSPINLLLYSVFRVGNASNNISWDSYELISGDDRVAWTIPLSLGDSHRGYRVMGTTSEFFQHFRYSTDRALGFSDGRAFESIHEAVIGSEIARELGYLTGNAITLSHGLGEISFVNHEDTPFIIAGILSATGTPVDQTVHITLAGMESVHTDILPAGGSEQSHEGHAHAAHEDEHVHEGHTEENEMLAEHPEQITAMLVGLNSRRAVFEVQGAINEFGGEPLLAILPGVALAELWQMMSTVENILALISALVLFASLLGLSTMLLSSMRERQREIFLFRSVGMHATSILLLIEIEAVLTTLASILVALFLATVCLWAGQSWLSQEYGLFISAVPLSPLIAVYLCIIVLASALLAFVPAITAYRSALGSGL